MAEAFEKDVERLGREVKEIVESPEWESRSAKEAVRQALKPLIYQAAPAQGPAEKEEGREQLPQYVQEAPESVKSKIEHLVGLVFKDG